jgi:hypothetical protein
VGSEAAILNESWQQRQKNPRPAAFFTLGGLPVLIEVEWPFHASTAGADFHVIHGRVTLADGSGLHADVSVHLSAVIKEALPSLEPRDTESAVVNAIRKDFDRKQLELMKSGKRQPVPVSSRHYDFKQKKLSFTKASDAQVADFLQRKVYWLAFKLGGPEARVWAADPYDAEYLNTTTAALLQMAQALAAQGVLRPEGEFAAATQTLTARAAEFEAAMQGALHALDEKHRFERG